MKLTNQKTNTLLILCNGRNQLAQLEVYNRYQQVMYNTALRIVKDTGSKNSGNTVNINSDYGEVTLIKY